MKPVTPAEAVEVLNRIHTADPTVLPTLIDVRVHCNEDLANDPTVQVQLKRGPEKEPRIFEVGFLGILNGIFGARPEDGTGWIAAYYDGDENDLGNLTHFGVMNG